MKHWISRLWAERDQGWDLGNFLKAAFALGIQPCPCRDIEMLFTVLYGCRIYLFGQSLITFVLNAADPNTQLNPQTFLISSRAVTTFFNTTCWEGQSYCSTLQARSDLLLFTWLLLRVNFKQLLCLGERSSSSFIKNVIFLLSLYVLLEKLAVLRILNHFLTIYRVFCFLWRVMNL